MLYSLQQIAVTGAIPKPKTVQPHLLKSFEERMTRTRFFFRKRARQQHFHEEIHRATTPVVEDKNTVAFIAFGRFKSLHLAGDLTGWKPSIPLERIRGTSVWIHRMNLPPDARIDYKFVVDGMDWILDPLNPQSIAGGYGENSELAMPDYQIPEELRSNSIPLRGTIDLFTLPDARSRSMRRVAVYLPPQYDHQAAPYPAVFVHDGIEFITLASMPHVLDYCIARGLIRPVVAVFVEPVDRMTEYWDSDAFESSFVNEILPVIEAQFNISPAASERAIMGASLGGLMALRMAYNNPEIWGNAAGLSTAIQIENGRFARQMLGEEPRAVRIYLDCGTFERQKSERDFFRLNKEFAAGLRTKGYDILWQEFNEGHSWGNWRAHVGDVLQYFFPAG